MSKMMICPKAKADFRYVNWSCPHSKTHTHTSACDKSKHCPNCVPLEDNKEK